MSVRFTFNHDIDTVAEKLFDPDFRVDRAIGLGEHSADCEMEGDEDSVSMVMNRELERELPAILAKVFNARQTMRFEESWERSGDGWQGKVNIQAEGQPIVITADYSLVPKGKGCEYTATHYCKAKIPLIGGKIEKFVLSLTDGDAEKELQYLADALA
ncbi:DUF2505 domain-containing protein [Spongiibacter sp. KMU-158]|uniref:DUF2505 domain-containing protein n=1 Tax=Spongiibacter pelagi TaxID=2760804 RepID=A0A927C3B2_9GAMM|nr:DUF2505 domain-containing protein [Spongiibacter pelagi]MBD2858996.1 DUF2505 domain-containing protein [Spongiibacter pelagi]